MGALRDALEARLREDLENYFSVPKGDPRAAARDLAAILAAAVEEAVIRHAVAKVPAGTFLVSATGGVPNPAEVDLEIRSR
ncbi:MAG: hypothetical protein L3J76_01215 [Candidatus Hydrothermae bacterium]|nr:hypothetical protein [Candidatus Hydrothermae bacterium]